MLEPWTDPFSTPQRRDLRALTRQFVEREVLAHLEGGEAHREPAGGVRLQHLVEAVKRVYASTFFQTARDYLETTPYRIEEELMAVLIQRLVGRQHGHRFYPTLSGVASSYNFYPFGNMKPEDGVAQVALGLGKSVVEGFEALRFSPAYPEVLPQFSSTQDILRNAQRRFYALDMTRDKAVFSIFRKSISSPNRFDPCCSS